MIVAAFSIVPPGPGVPRYSAMSAPIRIHTRARVPPSVPVTRSKRSIVPTGTPAIVTRELAASPDTSSKSAYTR